MCITQPAHAWVSGQLAQVWGNELFGSIAPYQAVCLGVEQHDIGWASWEAVPTFNPDTGYPHSFNEIATEVHTSIWAGAKHLTMPMGGYTALLISLHGTGLYERFTHWKKSSKTTQVVETFLQQEKQFQQQLIHQLEQDPAYAPYTTPEVITRNRQLIATLDALSLAICMGVTEQYWIHHVPTATGETTLTLMPVANEPMRLFVEPWCFQTNQVSVVVEGRLLEDRANDELTMRDCLAKAPWVTLSITLQPKD